MKGRQNVTIVHSEAVGCLAPCCSYPFVPERRKDSPLEWFTALGALVVMGWSLWSEWQPRAMGR